MQKHFTKELPPIGLIIYIYNSLQKKKRFKLQKIKFSLIILYKYLTKRGLISNIYLRRCIVYIILNPII